MAAIQEGLYLCTNCYRCTPVCPVGINLQDLWFNVREAVLKRGCPELLVLTPFSMYRGLMSPSVREEDYLGAQQRAMAGIEAVCTALSTPGEPIESTHMDRDFKKQLLASANGSTFSYCFTCTTCTSACPVVRSYKNPPEALGLTPHQIIRATALGLPDLIFRSKMLWYCLGCYQCQDSCPQAVRVADVLYELKNLAVARMKNASRSVRREIMKLALQRCCTTPIFLKQYETSTDAVLGRLGVELTDKALNCCGYPLKNYNYKAHVLASARNLSIAEKRKVNIMTFCNCCYGTLKEVNHRLKEDRTLQA